MKVVKSEPVTTPMSGAGIMRFFDISGGGPKVSPSLVIGVIAAFIVIELLLNVLS